MLCIKINKIKSSRGFTLIEVIVSLVVAGILGAMLYQFLGTGMMKSANPIIHVRNGAYLDSIMEKMYTDYKYQMTDAVLNGKTPQTAFSTFESNLDTANQYSDASHPYTVTKKRISFTGTQEDSAECSACKILKVTIKYQGLSATQLFTE